MNTNSDLFGLTEHRFNDSPSALEFTRNHDCASLNGSIIHAAAQTDGTVHSDMFIVFELTQAQQERNQQSA